MTPIRWHVARGRREVSAWWRDLGPWPLAFILVTWLVIFPRMVPFAAWDHGVWVSVAERLLAGDRLYAQVWENKDPLFLFQLAAARAVTPYGDIVVEVVWVVLAALSITVTCRALGLSRAASAVTGFGMVPVVLTGTAYLPGYSHLPALAASFGVFAALLSRRFVLSGVLFALVASLKLILLPIALCLVVAVVLWRRPRAREMAAMVFAAAMTLSLIAGLLAARGELVPYLQTQVFNVSYSQGSAAQESRWGPIVAHVNAVVTPGLWVTILVVTATGVLFLAVRGTVDQCRRAPELPLWWAVVLSLPTALAVVAVTGLWEHHGQALYAPAALAAVLVTWALVGAGADMRRPATLAGLACVALLVAGAPHPKAFTSAARDLGQHVTGLATVSPDALAILEVGDAGTYARVGTNDDSGHAYGLRSWDLVCPWFHQYPHLPADLFEDIVECLPSADVILVHKSAEPAAGRVVWNAYLDAVEDVLAQDYACQVRDFGRVCVRR